MQANCYKSQFFYLSKTPTVFWAKVINNSNSGVNCFAVRSNNKMEVGDD